MKHLSIASLVLVMFAWGCGTKESSSAQPVTGQKAPVQKSSELSAFTLNDLVGTWSSPCIEVEPSIYAIESFKFDANGAGAHLLSQGYLDSACKSPADPAEYPSHSDPFTFKIGKAMNDKRVTALAVAFSEGTEYTSFLIKGNKLMFSQPTDLESAVTAAVDEAEAYIKK